MFDLQSIDLFLLHLLTMLIRMVSNVTEPGSDPDETEVEPNP